MKKRAVVKREGRLKDQVVEVREKITNDDDYEGYYRCVIHGNDTSYAVHLDDLEFLEE